MAVLLLMAGAALLTAGAEAFAENVAPASARLGVSVLALGVLLAGAEPEEAITAAARVRPGAPRARGRRRDRREPGDPHPDARARRAPDPAARGPAALWSTPSRRPSSARSPPLLLLNGVLGRLEGLLLIALYVAGVVVVWRREQQPPLIGELAELERGPAHARASATTGRPAVPCSGCCSACWAWSSGARSRCAAPKGSSTSSGRASRSSASRCWPWPPARRWWRWCGRPDGVVSPSSWSRARSVRSPTTPP